MPLVRNALVVCLVLGLELGNVSCLFRSPAAKMYAQGRKLERNGQIAQAYLLYSKAAALAPQKRRYWLQSQAVKSRAALQVKLTTPDSTDAAPLEDPEPPPAPVTEMELREARKLQPPQELKASNIRHTFNLHGNARSLFEQVARVYGLDVVFDGDYQPGPTVVFRMDDVGYREALRGLEAVTGAFIFPLSDKLFMAAKDTQQKRTELEPAVAVTVHIPSTVTIQDAQELARNVQQTMEIRRFGVDTVNRQVLMSDRISKVRPAQAILEQLLNYRSEVGIEIEFLQVTNTDLLNFGLNLPSAFPSNWLKPGAALPAVGGYLQLLGGGATLFGIGIPDASFLANRTQSSSRTLFRTVVRSEDGLPATFHVGDHYPVLTAGYFGPASFSEGGTVVSPAPQITFEDLGLLVKITPNVHGTDEVTLDIDAEFQALGGSSLNGIPVITNRKLTSTVRVKAGQWSAVAGIMTTSEARSISGLAGLSQIPGLGALMRQNSRENDKSTVLILMRPHILSLSPDQKVTRTIWVGTEGRLNIPL
jgi:general secretion pathway protein D